MYIFYVQDLAQSFACLAHKQCILRLQSCTHVARQLRSDIATLEPGPPPQPPQALTLAVAGEGSDFLPPLPVSHALGFKLLDIVFSSQLGLHYDVHE